MKGVVKQADSPKRMQRTEASCFLYVPRDYLRLLKPVGQLMCQHVYTSTCSTTIVARTRAWAVL
jgi:hypothetical protein